MVQVSAAAPGRLENDDDVYNRGPLFLLVNALASVAVTYLASYSSLDISRALQAYDRLGFTIRAIPAPKSNWRLTIGYSLLLVAEFALIYHQYKTKDTRIMDCVGVVLYSILCFVGYSSILKIRDPPKEIYRKPSIMHSIPTVLSTEKTSVLDNASTLVIGIVSLYSGLHQNAWYMSLAMLGVAFIATRDPFLSNGGLSIRGVVFTCLGLTLYLAAGTAASVLFDTQDETSIPTTTSATNPLLDSLICAFQLWGALTGILTALILRYEYSISASASEAVIEQSPLPSAGTAPIISASEAKALRIPITKSHLSFPAPLFHTILLLTFLQHIPAIALSVPAAQWIRKSSAVPWGVHIAAKAIVVLPPQIWTIATMPLVVGVAVLLRKDGRALWSSFEPVGTKAEPAAEEAEGGAVYETSKIAEVEEPYANDVKA